MAASPMPGVGATSATAGLRHARLVYMALLRQAGSPCSTPELGRLLAGSEGRVRRAITRLRGLGLEIDTVRGRGYRLRSKLEPLAIEEIKAGLGVSASPLLDRLDLFFLTTSTNQLLQRPGSGPGGIAVLAEGQTGGRGRGGKYWYSPLGAGLYLSLGWRVRQVATPAALAMIPAVAVVRALHTLQASTARLKWPNDILLCDHDQNPMGKLGGILVETRGPGPLPWVVIGIGVNVRLPATGRPRGLACADLADAGLQTISRNHLAATVLDQLLPMLAVPPIMADLAMAWNNHDCIRGREVTLNTAGHIVTGEALGVDDEGRLKIHTPHGISRVRRGTLRLSQALQ